MSEEEIQTLIHYHEDEHVDIFFVEDGLHKLVTNIQSNFKYDYEDPNEAEEPVAWLSNDEGCRALWVAELADFYAAVEIAMVFQPRAGPVKSAKPQVQP